MTKTQHQRALDVLVHRCGRWSRVHLAGGRVHEVFNVAWGFDAGDDVAHITTNISPEPGVEHEVGFFRADEIVRIEDPESGTVLFATSTA